MTVGFSVFRPPVKKFVDAYAAVTELGEEDQSLVQHCQGVCGSTSSLAERVASLQGVPVTMRHAFELKEKLWREHVPSLVEVMNLNTETVSASPLFSLPCDKQDY
jgi:hypothetical protein